MKFLFISTNKAWGGSEELWSMAGIAMRERGFNVCFLASYGAPALDRLSRKLRRVGFEHRTGIPRLLKRLKRALHFKEPDKCFVDVLRKEMPDVVIISQGNNVGGGAIMSACIRQSIRYFTITQLVAEVHFLQITEFTLPILQKGFQNSLCNFFVSTNNAQLNDRMLGMTLSNSEVIFNPCRIRQQLPAQLPRIEKFNVALVGRVECFHKGYDLFVEVISSEKWKNRPVQFNIYGDGPHTTLLRKWLALYKIENVHIHGFCTDVVDIWKENMVLLLPSRMEGQSLSLVEAMFCGRFAITTNVGGAEELIVDGENGFLASCTAASIDDALERAWLLRNQWEELGLRARESISRKYPQNEVNYFVDRMLGRLSPK